VERGETLMKSRFLITAVVVLTWVLGAALHAADAKPTILTVDKLH
jgi:hypothetical protein